MGDINQSTAWGWLLSAAAAIVALAKAWEIVGKSFHFHVEDDYKDKMDSQSRRIDKLEQKIDKRQEVQDEEFRRLQEQTGVLCRAVFAQLNHELSGNDVEMLRKSRDELQSAQIDQAKLRKE